MHCLAPCYLPILQEGSGWPEAIAKLVAHFHRPSQWENYVPTNKDLRCRSRINKTGQMAAFGYVLLWDGATSIMFYKPTDGFSEIWCWISCYKNNSCICSPPKVYANMLDLHSGFQFCHCAITVSAVLLLSRFIEKKSYWGCEKQPLEEFTVTLTGRWYIQLSTNLSSQF